MGDQSQSPGFVAALVAALRNFQSRDPELAEEASEEISKKMPAALMPRGAVEAQRRRMAQLDELGKE